MSKKVIQHKTFAFAMDIIKAVQSVQSIRKEYVISKQLLKSGTAVGAMVRESEHAESRKDFIHKLNIALKEANESRYWLELLYRSEYLKEHNYIDLHGKCTEIIKILAAIVKSTRMRSLPNEG